MSFPWNWLSVVQEQERQTNETIFQLSYERAKLRALVAKLYPGIDDYWRTLPENAEAVNQAEEIYRQTQERPDDR